MNHVLEDTIYIRGSGCADPWFSAGADGVSHAPARCAAAGTKLVCA
ncbi:hypothetical protein [Methyloceanibacter caenitepidi]|uniref:Uncharacterized protein n=1 Tax=Methyloceanibacter caenitepidi TaxID=1384459 RepID=A0A0A8K6N9_9HYPH|nr:hypothetical protein [Methyloceanibacter caenitepidi]BAQ17669.1 hypothetical protein GL4_2227 [Methyloceanibacter caenitepidi]